MALPATHCQQLQISTLPDGRIAFAWTDNGRKGSDTSGAAIHARMLDTDEARFCEALQVNTTSQDHQYQPALAVFPDGRLAVAWKGMSGTDGLPTGMAIRAQVLQSGDTIIGSAGGDTLRVDLSGSVTAEFGITSLASRQSARRTRSCKGLACGLWSAPAARP